MACEIISGATTQAPLDLRTMEKSSKNKRLKIAGAVLVVLLAGFLALRSMHHASGDANAKGAPTELHFEAQDLTYLAPRPLASTLEINGNLEARSEAVVRAKASLDVKTIAVREGDPVRQGQLLAQLDTAELAARLAEKVSSRDSAKAQFELAEKNRTNNRTLLDKKFISQNAFDSSDSTFKANQSTMEAADAEVELARIALNQATVTAPISGIISKRYVKVGEKTSVDGELFAIVDLDSLEMQALVPDADVTRLQRGMKAKIQVDGITDQTFDATLDRISPATEAGTRSVMTFFSVNNAKHLLRSGIYASGEVALQASTPRPAIPLTAVSNDAGQPIVWTVENGKLTRRPVQLGIRDVNAGWVEVRKGLDPHVPVLATKFDDLKEGAPATAVAATDAKTVAPARPSAAAPAAPNKAPA
jgi:membrane fusion protein (multidrug efflux system)